MADTIEEYHNPDLCRACGKCCKQIWFWTENFDDYLRYKWLDSDLIEVESVNDGDCWRVRIMIPCKKLVYNEDTKLYGCKVHNLVRPEYCRTYPNNMVSTGLPKKYLEEEADFCPALKEILAKQGK